MTVANFVESLNYDQLVTLRALLNMSKDAPAVELTEQLTNERIDANMAPVVTWEGK